MPDVMSLLDTQTIESNADSDMWFAFREVEQITLELTQQYKYTLGKYSKFFIELHNKRFLATRCDQCEKVYSPPRTFCPECFSVTDWMELSGKGTVKTYSILHFSPGTNGDVRSLKTPYILAYVHLDGASTLFPHLLKADLDAVHIGMQVQVTYTDKSVEHPIHLMYFTPLEDAE